MLAVCGVMACGLAGCANDGGCHRSCGWRFEVVKPPIVTTTTPILIQSSSGQFGAHPMGSLAGPVTEGSATHAPAMPMPAGPLVPPASPPPGPQSRAAGMMRGGPVAFGAANCDQPCDWSKVCQRLDAIEARLPAGAAASAPAR